VKEATIIKIQDTGHMIQWENPEEVSSEIMNWVNKQETKTSYFIKKPIEQSLNGFTSEVQT
jgi:hypothetical protein